MGKGGTNHVSRLSRAAGEDEGYVLAGAVLELVGGGRLACHEGWEGISINGPGVGSCCSDGGEGRDENGLELHICGWSCGLIEVRWESLIGCRT